MSGPWKALTLGTGFFAIFLVALAILPFALMSDDRGPDITDRGEDLSVLFRRYRWILFLMAHGVGIEISAVRWGATGHGGSPCRWCLPVSDL